MTHHQRRLEKEAHWREHITQQANSGDTIRRYCLDHELSEPSFYAWRRELATRDAERDQGATRGAADSSRTADQRDDHRDRSDHRDHRDHRDRSDHGGPRNWVALDVIAATGDAKLEIDLPNGGAKLEIDLPNGVVIRLRECVPIDTLERVLRAACDQQNHSIARDRSANRGPDRGADRGASC